MDEQRLERCNAFLSSTPTVGWRNTGLERKIKKLQRERVEVEKRGILQKLRIREAAPRDDIVSTAWRVRDAVERFKQYDFLKRYGAESQKELDEVLKTMFADGDARKAYIASLAGVSSFPTTCKDGCIFVAAVEGAAGISRVVGFCMFSSHFECDCTFEYDGIKNCCSLRLLPMSEIVLQEHHYDMGCRVWAWRERRAQVFLHGIDNVHLGFSTRDGMFQEVCGDKNLCRRCGGDGHTADGCRAAQRAAWAGGDAL
jgi:hypothetical protein